jgi:hypothetical protein
MTAATLGSHLLTLAFDVTFHQPFLVASGLSADGKDAVAREDAPLPASSLKGAMRYAATQVLDVPAGLVAEVFGMEGRQGGRLGQGAWAWGDAGPSTSLARQTRARNRVDPLTGAVQGEALVASEEWWQTGALGFEVDQLRWLPADEFTSHHLVLAASAWAVTALGSWRNRGMGSVTIRPADPVADLATRLLEVTQ